LRGERAKGKRTKGRKFHIVTDTVRLLVGFAVHGANIQDRDRALDLLKSTAVTCSGLQIEADVLHEGCGNVQRPVPK
jgi:hypothetical protein